ncbi:MAG: hypothetical protein WC831_05710, partial [Parcubacteria group bacterium]
GGNLSGVGTIDSGDIATSGTVTSSGTGSNYFAGNVGIGTTSPSQALDIFGSINLPNTTSSTTGVIYKNGAPFIHNFIHPTGNTAIPEGMNTFVGLDAGNFTMGSTATSTAQGSYNTGTGYAVLQANTIGYGNTANGMTSLQSNTEGNYNTANGVFSLKHNTTGSSNTTNGAWSLIGNTTGNNNTANGSSSLQSNTTGSYNTANGASSLQPNIDGTYNTALGVGSGAKIADGATGNKTSDYSIYLGSNTKALADGGQNEIVIGYDATGLGSNSVVLGNNSIVTTALKGNVGIGTTAPAVKLDVNGEIKYKKNSAEPYACDAAHDSAVSLTNKYTTCVCKNGTGWVLTSDGTTACTWN